MGGIAICISSHTIQWHSTHTLFLVQVFSKVGDVKRIVMGLDKQKHTPCGFCFVIYYTRGDAANAVKYVNGSLLDERPIRVDFDWGFQEGRQFGRGRSGGQVCCWWWCVVHKVSAGISMQSNHHTTPYTGS